MDPEQRLHEISADLHLQPEAFDAFKALMEQHLSNGLGPQWRVAIAQGLPGVFLAKSVLAFMHIFGGSLWPSAPQKRDHLTPSSRKSKEGFWEWNNKTAGYEGPVLLVDGRVVETRNIPLPRDGTFSSESVNVRSHNDWLTKASFNHLRGPPQARLRGGESWSQTEAGHHRARAALVRTVDGRGSKVRPTCRRGEGTPRRGTEAQV